MTTHLTGILLVVVSQVVLGSSLESLRKEFLLDEEVGSGEVDIIVRDEDDKELEILALRVGLPTHVTTEVEVEKHGKERCCLREKKMQVAGLDITGKKLHVDVGQCKKSCPLQQSVQEDLLDEIGKKQVYCSAKKTCEPSLTTMERVNLMEGIKEVTVVNSCHCMGKPRNCKRKPSRIRIFPETTYEVVLDVGTCLGHCQPGHICRPSRNRTVSLEGPNGSVCMNITEECACAADCYRMGHVEVFVEQLWNTTTNTSQTETKEIDVGQCVGVCSKEKFTCMVKDPEDESKCLMSLKEKTACAASRLDKHTIRKETEIQTVFAIKECSCN